MKRLVLIVSALCAMSPAAMADPVRLSDAALDGVVAGRDYDHDVGRNAAPSRNSGGSGSVSNVNYTSQVATATSVAIVECIDCVINGSLTLSAVAISSASNTNVTAQRIR